MNKELVVKLNPKLFASETIKMARTNLMFIKNNDLPQTLLVTSSLPGEGKSFIACNLATSLAQLGKKVIVVDCDLRKGRMHEIFYIHNKSGLTNLLMSGELEQIDSYVEKTYIDNLDVITRGEITFNPAELLTYKTFDIVLEKLKEKYEYIILDGTPVIGLSDAVTIAKKVDMVSIVSSIGVGTTSSLQQTKKTLNSVNANVIGVIVNRVQPTKDRFYKYEL